MHALSSRDNSLSKRLKNVEVLLRTDPEGSEVAFDLKHRQIFFGADDHRPHQVRPIPHPMIAFLAD